MDMLLIHIDRTADYKRPKERVPKQVKVQALLLAQKQV